MEQTLIVKITVSPSNVQPVYEVWDKLAEVLTEMMVEGRVQEFNVSMGERKQEPVRCLICNKLVGHPEAVEVHRRIEKH